MGERGFPPAYQGIPMAAEARHRIGSTWGLKTPYFDPEKPQYPHPQGGGKVFRVRTGNGHFGSIAGEKYQDAYDYVPPSNPRTEQQQDWRLHFWEEVRAAQLLSEEEKEPYREIAKRVKGWSWFSAYMSEHMPQSSPKG